MNVLVFASKKGGAGKSTLAAHLASYIADSSRSTLLIDADPQGSLSLWHRLRGQNELGLKVGIRDISKTLAKAKQDGVEWVIIDTPPNTSPVVSEAIRHATLVVIPTRASLFDIDAVRHTAEIARSLKKPYAAVINAAPAKHGDEDAAVVADARGALAALQIPVWAGQITHRPELSLSLAYGEGVNEYGERSVGADELGRLWTALDRSIQAVNNALQNRGRKRTAA